MNFFKKYEKALVKSLVYGLVAGLFGGILFISRKVEVVNGGMHSFYEKSLFDFVMEILRTSVVVSILTCFAVLLYLYVKERSPKS